MTIEKALRMFPMTEAIKNLRICDKGTSQEHYIDPRTSADSNFNYTVYPLTENSFMYAYVCPNCQRIHIAPKKAPAVIGGKKPDEHKHYFQVPENEIAPEHILEWKMQVGSNCMITIADPDGMTTYQPYVYNLLTELRQIAVRTDSKELIAAYSNLFSGFHPEYWDEDQPETTRA